MGYSHSLPHRQVPAKYSLDSHFVPAHGAVRVRDSIAFKLDDLVEHDVAPASAWVLGLLAGGVLAGPRPPRASVFAARRATGFPKISDCILAKLCGDLQAEPQIGLSLVEQS